MLLNHEYKSLAAAMILNIVYLSKYCQARHRKAMMASEDSAVSQDEKSDDFTAKAHHIYSTPNITYCSSTKFEINCRLLFFKAFKIAFQLGTQNIHIFYGRLL